MVVWLQHWRATALPGSSSPVLRVLFQPICVLRHIRPVERQLLDADNASLVRHDRRDKPTEPDLGTDGCRRIRDPRRLVGRNRPGAVAGNPAIDFVAGLERNWSNTAGRE